MRLLRPPDHTGMDERREAERDGGEEVFDLPDGFLDEVLHLSAEGEAVESSPGASQEAPGAMEGYGFGFRVIPRTAPVAAQYLFRLECRLGEYHQGQ